MPHDGGDDLSHLFHVTEDQLDGRIRALFRDEYHYAHLALEAHAEVAPDELNVPGYMNVRDALAHLRVVLDGGNAIGRRVEHLVCAREHLRRAASEAFHVLVRERYDQVSAAYAAYRSQTAPEALRRGSPVLHHPTIAGKLRSIRELMKRSRLGRDGTEWKTWTRRLIEALDDLADIRASIEGMRERTVTTRHLTAGVGSAGEQSLP